jgi:hypothetical protein
MVLIVGLMGSWAHARCDVAIYVVESSTSSQIVQKIAKRFDTIARSQVQDSRAYAVSDPAQAADANYMYLVIPEGTGKISVSVNDLLGNRILYRNVYNSNAFKSENELVQTMASDFARDVLSQLEPCLQSTASVQSDLLKKYKPRDSEIQQIDFEEICSFLSKAYAESYGQLLFSVPDCVDGQKDYFGSRRTGIARVQIVIPFYYKRDQFLIIDMALDLRKSGAAQASDFKVIQGTGGE